jgi:hypothetical protein
MRKVSTFGIAVIATALFVASGTSAILAVTDCQNPNVAQVTFMNNAGEGLFLYVDGTARCHAGAQGSCVTAVDSPGRYKLGAVTSDGTTRKSNMLSVRTCDNYTWTVWKD